MNIGRKILELRKQKNISQEKLAAELGVTAAAVSKWENGYTLPDIMMLCALADFFEVTTDELLGRIHNWKYAVIGAETQELGAKMAEIAREHGIAAKSIHTSFQEAIDAADNDTSIRYIIAGYHSGWYEHNGAASVLVSVHPNEEEILYGFRMILEKYLRDDEHQFIIN